MDIVHRIGVKDATPRAVYDALTTVDGLAAWWTTDTKDDGDVLRFRFPPVGGFDMQVVATSLVTGRPRWFSQGPVVEPVLASAALPAIFPPVMIDGEAFIDGGVVDNVPISRAVALGAHRVYVLHVGNFARPRQLPRRPIDVLLQSFSIARNHRFLAETDDPPPDVELVVLPGVDPGRLRRNDFSRSRDLMDGAYAAAREFLAGREEAAAGRM